MRVAKELGERKTYEEPKDLSRGVNYDDDETGMLRKYLMRVAQELGERMTYKDRHVPFQAPDARRIGTRKTHDTQGAKRPLEWGEA